MKKIIQLVWIKALAGAALSALLFSFSNISLGAHSIQVYLDDKAVVDQHIHSRMDVPKLMLDPTDKHNQMIVKYDECGRTVSGRVITIKDYGDKVLKEWRFDGTATGYKDPMTCSWKEITALTQKGNTTLKMYYSSKDFPEGQQIAYLIFANNKNSGGKN